jgi:outer membrane protein OmpA-like peptidoglycan-associated protein
MKYTFIILVLTLSSLAQSQENFAIRFDFNKASISKNEKTRIDSFLLALKKQDQVATIELHGHCDFIGSDSYNNLLSEKRVTAVFNYFLANGIQKDKIKLSIGHGEKDPLNADKTDEARRMNRRVEILLFNEAAGAVAEKEILTATNEKLTITEKLADTNIVAGSNIILKNINFVGGRHQFLPESMPMLEELLTAMNTYPSLVIQIEGHICCLAEAGEGLDLETGINNLSRARAKAVQDFLIGSGIDPGRISYKGYGHSRPLFPFPEKTAEEETLNRRVEIKIIKR